MFPITGITGKVGGTLARKLLEAEQPVCTVVRDAAKDRHGPIRELERLHFLQGSIALMQITCDF
jgi:uncharacterized protein YbjT (DUF2867 family)